MDDGDPLYEDFFFSDFDGDALSSISISSAEVKETQGTVESWQILRTGHDITSPIEGVCKFYFLSVVYLVQQNNLVVVASQNYGTWQTWIQFSSLMIKKSWIITEEYPY